MGKISTFMIIVLLFLILLVVSFIAFMTVYPQIQYLSALSAFSIKESGSNEIKESGSNENIVRHTIKDECLKYEDECITRCQDDCRLKDMTFERIDFFIKETRCNTCFCTCK